MSTEVVGFKEADEQWKKMKSVWDSCEHAEIKIPEEVYNYFNGENPGDKPGFDIDLKHTSCCSEYNYEYGSGYEIKISDIPEGVSIIRFINSW